MNPCYVDSSVLLRIVLAQPDQLSEWEALGVVVTSELTEGEVMRTLDRVRLTHGLSLVEIALRQGRARELLATLEVFPVHRIVLRRAAQPLPTPLGTLDALHLATALLVAEQLDAHVTVATHDVALATAARSVGLGAIGV